MAQYSSTYSRIVHLFKPLLAAVTEGGSVYTFGLGFFWRLGHGDQSTQPAPRRVLAAGFNGERVVMVAAGNAHAVAVGEAGHVFTWGYGMLGQLGYGDRESQIAPRSARTSALGDFMLTLSSVLPSILKQANSGYHTGLHQSKHHTKHPANESSAAAG